MKVAIRRVHRLTGQERFLSKRKKSWYAQFGSRENNIGLFGVDEANEFLQTVQNDKKHIYYLEKSI